MAAYGALVSVMQIMDQLHRHPHPPISLHKEQAESLTANLTFLQKFLEGYNPRISYTSEADLLESRIAEAAYAAEDVIENYIVDQIHARSTDNDSGKISSTQFYQDLEKVIQEMDMIKVEVMKKKMQVEVQIIKKQPTADDAASLRSSPTARKVTAVVGLDDALYEMLDKITGGERVRQIIPIVGMGGLGKTTLARNIYANPRVKEYFDICAWSTISQLHNARKILTEILSQVDKEIEKDLSDGDKEIEKDLSDGELGLELYKHLLGKRYFIVMDDMWNIEAWDKVRSFFPENGNGSRVVVTTRLSNLASMFNRSNGLEMKFMDEDTSWKLFSKTVFGEGIFPPELKDVGKKILKGCRGLPLSIVVVGGLLSELEATQEKWKVIEENLSSVVNSKDEGSCLHILYTSYNNLPVHLKPCFLYNGVFPEDEEIQIYILIPLMVAEGFIKPIDGKSLEEAAQEYLKQLVDRNLVLVERHDSCGVVESIKIHDLLRDLALREGEKDKFLYSLKHSSGDRAIYQEGMISGQRHIANWLKKEYTSSGAVFLESAVEVATVRSLIGRFGAQILPISRYRLLRVCFIFPKGEKNSVDEYYEEIFIWQLNLRFLLVNAIEHRLPKIPCYLWNLQTLVLYKVYEYYVLEIWKMPLLRHVITDRPLYLSAPPPDDKVIVLENLHTLYRVRNLKLSEEVLKRIPSIKILKLYYMDESDSESDSDSESEEEGDYYCFNNLHHLNKLEELHLDRYGWEAPSVQGFSLPYSLKKLTLIGTRLPWKEMTSKIGCLPLLQVLRLGKHAFIGSEWETVEGQFSSLIFLEIRGCKHLEQWITDDNAHFPRLEQLVLSGLKKLSEIPSSIGDIPTLGSIELEECSDSAVESARRIQEEQEEYGTEVVQIQVKRRSYR